LAAESQYPVTVATVPQCRLKRGKDGHRDDLAELDGLSQEQRSLLADKLQITTFR